MTKPSDFIFNSDYLALAETARQDFDVFIPSMNYNINPNTGFDKITIWSTTLNCPVDKSAIESFQLTYNGKTFVTDSIYSMAPWKATPGGLFDPPYWILSVYRKDANTLEVKVFFRPEIQSEGDRTPQINLNIAVCSFRPPNVL